MWCVFSSAFYFVAVTIGTMDNRYAPALGKVPYIGQEVFNTRSENQFLGGECVAGICAYFKPAVYFRPTDCQPVVKSYRFVFSKLFSCRY